MKCLLPPRLERCPWHIHGYATNLAMEMYPLCYAEEVWPDYGDDVDMRPWYCSRCNAIMSVQEDQRGPHCDGDLWPVDEPPDDAY